MKKNLERQEMFSVSFRFTRETVESLGRKRPKKSSVCVRALASMCGMCVRVCARMLRDVCEMLRDVCESVCVCA